MEEWWFSEYVIWEGMVLVWMVGPIGCWKKILPCLHDFPAFINLLCFVVSRPPCYVFDHYAKCRKWTRLCWWLPTIKGVGEWNSWNNFETQLLTQSKLHLLGMRWPTGWSAHLLIKQHKFSKQIFNSPTASSMASILSPPNGLEYAPRCWTSIRVQWTFMVL